MVSLELGKETMRKIFRLFTSVEQETFLSPHQDSESLWELRIFSLSNARHETKNYLLTFLWWNTYQNASRPFIIVRKVVIVIANQSPQEFIQDEKHLKLSFPEYLIRNVLFGLRWKSHRLCRSQLSTWVWVTVGTPKQCSFVQGIHYLFGTWRTKYPFSW